MMFLWLSLGHLAIAGCLAGLGAWSETYRPWLVGSAVGIALLAFWFLVLLLVIG